MQFHVPGCRPPPSDEINAKMLHFTYAGLHRGELSHASLLAAARAWGANRGGLLEYVTGCEKHTAPADPSRDEHFHAYFMFGKKVHLGNRRTSTLFDLRGRHNRVLHPEIQSVGGLPGDRQRVIEYDMKDGDWKGELRSQIVRNKAFTERVGSDNDDDDDDSNEADAESDPKNRWANRLLQASSVRDGMQRLAEEAPHVYFTMGTRIQPMLEQYVGNPDDQVFTLADFTMPQLDLDIPVVLHGKSGTGKSEFAAAHFAHPLIVRTRDDLKHATFNTDGIIFDDMDFASWGVEEVIHLLSMDKNRSIPARYTNAHLAAHTPLIFTTNKSKGKIFPRAKEKEQRRAIKRRHRCVNVRTSLARLGRPFTAAEMAQRRSAGQNGPQGPH